MYSYIFRVDAGDIAEIGTGHLYRCITIYDYLLQKGLKKEQLKFVIKSKKNFSLGKKILNKRKINFISIDNRIKDFSKQELDFLNTLKSKVIIFDRLSLINRNFLNGLKPNHKRIIGIDIKKKNNLKLDLYINPLQNNLIDEKKFQNYKNNILPSFFHKNKNKNKINIGKKNLNFFTFFGGYDFKNINKKIKAISKIKSMNIKSGKNFFYLNLKKADIIICSGGLTVFDAIYFNKIIIAIPQYNHQLVNLKCLHNKKVCFLVKTDKSFEKNLNVCLEKILSLSLKEKILIYKKQKKIICQKSQIKLLNKIYECSKSVF